MAQVPAGLAHGVVVVADVQVVDVAHDADRGAVVDGVVGVAHRLGGGGQVAGEVVGVGAPVGGRIEQGCADAVRFGVDGVGYLVHPFGQGRDDEPMVGKVEFSAAGTAAQSHGVDREVIRGLERGAGLG